MKIFGTYDEKFLNAVVLYYKSADGILYKDSAKTAKASKAEVANLFKKGVLIVDDGTNLIRPTGCTLGSTYTTVFHTTVGTSDIAVKTCYYSDGYTAG